MKNFRKILALILVVATLASFMLVADAATNYTDARNITHGSAVDLLSGLGVVNGYENGSFKPTSSVTRAEMAKMLSFVMNGGTDVGDMYAGACTFADSASHWAKGYIGYCVTMGLINGKNASTFAPDEKVTGYEAAKMMLCALGYKADLNGLTGAQWNTNAHSLGIKAKLFERLVDYTPSKALNRDDTCQMIVNTMVATKVETTGTITDIEGIVITGDVTNTFLTNTRADYAGRTDEDPIAPGNQNYLQLVEDCFSGVKLTPGKNDNFGRPCDEWVYKGTVLASQPVASPVHISDSAAIAGAKFLEATGGKIPLTASVYMNGALVSTGGALELAAQLSDAKSTLSAALKAEFAAATDANTVISLLNKVSETNMAMALATVSGNSAGGRAAGAWHMLARIWKKSTTSLAYYYLSSGHVENGGIGGSGLHTEVYFDELTQHMTVCFAPYYYGKVTGIRPAVTDANGDEVFPAYITMAPVTSPGSFGNLVINDNVTIPGNPASVPVLMDSISLDEESGDLKVGSYIAYYAGTDKNLGTMVVEGAIPIQTVKTALMQTRQYNNTSYDYRLRAKDKTYYYYNGYGSQIAHEVGPEYIIYYAPIGGRNIFFYSEGNVGNYVYIYNAAEIVPAVVQTFGAKLVKANGAVENVETDKNYMTNVGSIATTSVNSAGKTVLTPVGVFSGNFNVKVSINNSNSTVLFDGIAQTADTNTTFVIGTTDAVGNEIFTVYKGIQKVPSTTGAQYYAYVLNDLGTLDTVFLVNASGMTSNVQEGVLVKTGEELMNTDGKGNYYTVQAIMNNEVTTLQLTDTVYANLGANGLKLFNGYTTDANGLISGMSTVAGTKLNPATFTAAQGGNVVLNGIPYTYNDNVLVYTYSVLNKTLSISNVESLLTLNNTFDSYYTLHELYPNKPLAGIFAIID